MSVIKKLVSSCLFLCLHFSFFSQIKSTPAIRIDFNEHQIKEVDDRIKLKPVGISLTYDRFGNKESAIQTLGVANSYLNLSNSPLLKHKKTTIALWVKVLARVHAGKGYQANPFLIMRRDTSEDFNIAYAISYNPSFKEIGAWASKDSIQEVSARTKDTVLFNTWYHIVLTSDNDFFTFYLDGEQQVKAIKNFETMFAENDSVIVGRAMGHKNIRYTLAVFDDICIYDRVLDPDEIKDLYNEPNPNRFKAFLNEAFKYLLIILILVVIIIVLVARNKRKLKQQKEYYELNNKITELELKVIRTQMNPHFISNNLAAIQNLIYLKEIHKAGQYLAKFSFFLRQVLDYSDRTYTTLEEELLILTLNVELEQLRFENNFTFTVSVDNGIDVQNIFLPSLITQPFIENAIWHGLIPLTQRSPKLFVRVYSKEKYTYLEIEDNGVGRVNHSSNKNSMGTKLALDKIESINRLRKSTDYTFHIEDLFDEAGQPTGTKIIIILTPSALEE